MGQYWYSPKGFCWISGGYKRDVIYCDIALPYTPSLFLERVFDKTWIYCPTVEDMLSLLKPSYNLEREWTGGRWGVFTVEDQVVLYESSLPVLLVRLWIDHRYVFEDTAGSIKE